MGDSTDPVLPQILDEGFIPHWDLTLSNEAYHGDKTAVSSSVLKLFEKSSASVLSYYMASEEEDEPDHFKLGRAVHMASLEPKLFAECVILEQEFKGTGSRKERADWKAAQPATALILKPKEYMHIKGMIQSILDYPDAASLLSHGSPEISGYYRDAETGVKCKIRPDLWNEQKGILLDVKSCVDCSPRAFSRKIYEYKYHLSMAMYSEGIYQITGKRPTVCVFLAVEKKPPYERAVYICSEKMLQKGYEEYSSSMQKLKYCLDTKLWPCRQNEWEELDLPEFVYKKELEIYE